MTSRSPWPLSTLLGRAEAQFAAEFDALLKDAGLTGMTLAHGANVMRHLDETRPVRLGALADQAHVTKQAISQQVAQLESHGFVHVERDPIDRRSKTVRLTDKGKRSQQIARPLFSRLERQWHRRYGPAEVRDLRRILESILDHEA